MARSDKKNCQINDPSKPWIKIQLGFSRLPLPWSPFSFGEIMLAINWKALRSSKHWIERRNNGEAKQRNHSGEEIDAE